MNEQKHMDESQTDTQSAADEEPLTRQVERGRLPSPPSARVAGHTTLLWRLVRWFGQTWLLWFCLLWLMFPFGFVILPRLAEYSPQLALESFAHFDEIVVYLGLVLLAAITFTFRNSRRTKATRTRVRDMVNKPFTYWKVTSCPLTCATLGTVACELRTLTVALKVPEVKYTTFAFPYHHPGPIDLSGVSVITATLIIALANR